MNAIDNDTDNRFSVGSILIFHSQIQYHHNGTRSDPTEYSCGVFAPAQK